MKGVKKSKNFDRNMNSDLMKKQIMKNLYQVSSIINTTAKQKYVPIATRKIYNSVKLKKGKNNFKLSSLNYTNTAGTNIDRYNYDKANKSYKTASGNLITAGKNKDKYQWFHKSADKNKKNIEKLKTKGVIK